MYPTDPISVQQLRRADLIAAEQDRLRHRPDLRPSAAQRRLPRGSSRSRRLPALDESLELFVDLNRRERDRLARHFTIIDVAEGDSLARQGEPTTQFVVVLSGRIGVTLDGLALAVLDPGAHFGALPLLDGGPGRFSRASFSVLEPSRVAVADRHQFFKIMDAFPLVGSRIVQLAEIRRAYLRGHADATAIAADRDVDPFPIHLVEQL
ncbi:MAG TPA: cyclic nucleotide-binding domain-containing protein [Ilumatobacteraceae bacterium]|jgi:CRP-like cAMP-binding protein|nr:cyclic nucleotide-binding domain-containing protein [Ilumatobacteraceae bacterium]